MNTTSEIIPTAFGAGTAFAVSLQDADDHIEPADQPIDARRFVLPKEDTWLWRGVPPSELHD